MSSVARHHTEWLSLLKISGPDDHLIPLRRTDQALLRPIDIAQDRLHLLSFARPQRWTRQLEQRGC